jgi:hypothetical protein
VLETQSALLNHKGITALDGENGDR